MSDNLISVIIFCVTSYLIFGGYFRAKANLVRERTRHLELVNQLEEEEYVEQEDL